MSRFVYVAALLLCAGLVAAEGGEGGNPMDAINGFAQGLTQKFMQLMAQMNSAANCPTACAEGCSVEAQACIDIPDVLNCADESAACATACDEVCGCLANCGTQCGACPPTEDIMELLGCMVQSSMCMGPCEAACPVNEFSKEAQAGADKTSAMISGLMQQIMGMMPQGQQPAA